MVSVILSPHQSRELVSPVGRIFFGLGYKQGPGLSIYFIVSKTTKIALENKFSDLIASFRQVRPSNSKLEGLKLELFELLIRLSISGSRATNGTKEITIVTTDKLKKSLIHKKKTPGDV